jgi:hypothetical protein
LEQQDDYLDSEFLPDGLELKEPSKVHRNDIKIMITHWKERQDDPAVDVTFWFKKVQGPDKKLIRAVLPRSQPASGQSGPSASTDRGKKGKGTGKGKGKEKHAKKAPVRPEDSAPEEDEIRQALNDVDDETSDQESGRARARDRESSERDIDLERYLGPEEETEVEPNEDEAEAEKHRQVVAQKALLKPKPKPKPQPKPKPARNVQPESDREVDRSSPRKSQRQRKPSAPAAPEPTTARPKPKPAYKKAPPVEPRVTRSSEKRTADGDPEAGTSKRQKSSNTGPIEEEADPGRNKKATRKGSKYVFVFINDLTLSFVSYLSGLPKNDNPQHVDLLKK